MLYSESLQNCVYLLNKYRWMAGDTTNPEVKCKVETERKMTPCRPVTKEDKKLILDLYKQGVQYKQIVKQSGRAYAVIRRVLASEGIERKVIYKHMSQEDSDKIRNLWLKGMTPYLIAKELGMAETTVRSKCKKFGSRSSAGSALTSAAKSGQ